MRRRACRLAVALLTTALLASQTLTGVAAAQQVLSVEPPPPPYEDQLLRLSEILGAIHYLRNLCDHEKDVWRAQMAALLDSEAPDEARRARMIDRFNRGYEGFRSVYRTCTPAAATSSDRYLQEGARIAADITARYGK